MFTGISKELGKVIRYEKVKNGVKITISANEVLRDLNIGDSIMTDGICLTVTNFDNNSYTADIMNESLKVTKFDNKILGKYVNLERALSLNGRLDGHIVQGHVDGVGKIISIIDNKYKFKTKPQIAKYIVNKGSVAIDGISLTVSFEASDIFEVSLIPETISATNFKYKKIGDLVNIETDILSRIIEKLNIYNNKEDISQLLRNGY